MNNISFGKHSLHCKIKREDRKSISLTVNPDLDIILKCPYETKHSEIKDFIKRKWFWIEDQKRFFKGTKNSAKSYKAISGSSFYYLGRQYMIKVVETQDVETVKLKRGVLTVNTNNDANNEQYNQKLINKWLDNKRVKIFNQRFNKLLKEFEYFDAPKLEIRTMSKRWGSYISQKKILLNPKLIHTSTECIDYVIIHELCHLKYKNHSKDFWNLLTIKMPDWKKTSEKLEVNYGLI